MAQNTLVKASNLHVIVIPTEQASRLAVRNNVYASKPISDRLMKTEQKIIPHLWLNDQAEEMARFYTSLFDDSSIGRIARYSEEGQEIHGQPAGSVLTVEFEIAGFSMIALNGGPHFKLNPSISLFVVCESESEIDALWTAFSDGGEVAMPLDKYHWSEKYGWVQDRFGLSWQLSLGDISDVGQKITPSLLFVKEQHGTAEEALQFYTSVFDDSEIDGILHYGPGDEIMEGTVQHAQFKLNGEVFMAMDGGLDHEFMFNEAFSLLIRCEDQQEIDYFWEKLTAGGEIQQCGWLKDRFGVAWQVAPDELGDMIHDPDADKVARVTNAFLQMKKFDLAELRRAFEGKTTEGEPA